MSYEVQDQPTEAQSRLLGVDQKIWALGSAALELGSAVRQGVVKLGARVLSAELDLISIGLQPIANASSFLKSELAQPELDKTPKDAIWEDERAVLYKYKTPDTLYPGHERQRVPLVTVFALMNSGEILGKTIVPEMLKYGFDLYRVDWKEPQRGDENSGLEDYFLHTLPEALEQVKADASVEEVSLLGWCQGGYGTTILTALQGQMAERAGLTRPDLGIRNLIQLTTPLSISEEEKTNGGFAKMANDPKFNPEAIIKANGGIFPGSMIDYGAKGLKSYDNNIGTHFRLWDLTQKGDKARVDTWEEMNGWAKNIRNMPGKIYLHLIKSLYRDNRLAEGELELEGMRVDLAKLKGTSVLTIIAGKDHIVTPAQTLDAMHLIGSTDHDIINNPKAGHVSIGSRETCDKMAEWLTPRSK
jgi:polyhydroxyalkanoate synthase subunit PhaC